MIKLCDNDGSNFTGIQQKVGKKTVEKTRLQTTARKLGRNGPYSAVQWVRVEPTTSRWRI